MSNLQITDASDVDLASTNEFELIKGMKHRVLIMPQSVVYC